MSQVYCVPQINEFLRQTTAVVCEKRWGVEKKSCVPWCIFELDKNDGLTSLSHLPLFHSSYFFGIVLFFQPRRFFHEAPCLLYVRTFVRVSSKVSLSICSPQSRKRNALFVSKYYYYGGCCCCCHRSCHFLLSSTTLLHFSFTYIYASPKDSRWAAFSNLLRCPSAANVAKKPLLSKPSVLQ